MGIAGTKSDSSDSSSCCCCLLFLGCCCCCCCFCAGGQIATPWSALCCVLPVVACERVLCPAVPLPLCQQCLCRCIYFSTEGVEVSRCVLRPNLAAYVFP